MNWSVRGLEMSDVPTLLDWYNNEELHYTANAKSYKPYSLEELTQYWQEKLARSHAKYYVIMVDQQVVGRVGLKKDRYEVEYSILIGVSTIYSKGIGTEVTKHFVAEAFLDPDVSTVCLGVRTDNHRAIRCYEKAGFKVTKKYEENRVNMYEMRINRWEV
jgi:RimJ/RimL family protein N-acetyltransferase